MPTNVEKLEKDLTDAWQAEAAAQEQAQTARAQYQAAVEAGDMDAAAQRQAEVERAQAQAQMHADRVETLEGRRSEAEAADAMPAYTQAMKEARAAIKAEADAHQRTADLVRQLADARRDLDAVHTTAGTAIMQAHAAADAAGEARPAFSERSRMAAVVGVDDMHKAARELANVAADQSQKAMAARERARKAA